MKKALCLALLLCLLAVPALADTFLDDFNFYAEYTFGIATAALDADGYEQLYTAPAYSVLHNAWTGTATVTAQPDHALDAITAACCALRVMDNSGSAVDQYGRVLHAYFMACTRGTECRATTDSGVLVYVTAAPTVQIRLVK